MTDFEPSVTAARAKEKRNRHSRGTDMPSSPETIRPSDPLVIIAGIRRFGLAPDGADLRDLEAALRASQPATPGGEAREQAAQLIYDLLPYDLPHGVKPKWVSGGNSLKQDECRRAADRILALATPTGGEAEPWSMERALTDEDAARVNAALQSSKGCGDPGCTDPNCEYGKGDDAAAALARSSAGSVSTEFGAWLDREMADIKNGLSDCRTEGVEDQYASGYLDALVNAKNALPILRSSDPAQASRNDVIEECAKFVEQNQEAIKETSRGSERYLSPRKVGNQMGLAYVDGIRGLAIPSTERGCAHPHCSCPPNARCPT